MPNITETISLLDELGNGDTDRYYLGEELIQAYPALRQAALDGERYRKAGEALAEAMERITTHEDNGYWDYSEVYDSIVNNKDAALEAYRQAVEQKLE